MHIVLVEPEIPPNTGNIARSCAATGSILHLVEPLGFSIEDKSLKRAGLDYWPFVKLEVHKSLEAFMQRYGVDGDNKTMYLATTKGKYSYAEVAYKDEDMIIFGKETAGLPKEFIAANEEKSVRIPMGVETNLRSLNLSNSVNIILFESLRQQDFPTLR